jgi:hypothetical protein
VPIVTINTLSVPVARSGAALPHVAAPWANPSGAGVRSALPQNPGQVLGRTSSAFATPRRTAVMARSRALAAAWLQADIRKQYVHKTRVNAGGDGATGPHPEREPA